MHTHFFALLSSSLLLVFHPLHSHSNCQALIPFQYQIDLSSLLFSILRIAIQPAIQPAVPPLAQLNQQPVLFSFVLVQPGPSSFHFYFVHCHTTSAQLIG